MTIAILDTIQYSSNSDNSFRSFRHGTAKNGDRRYRNLLVKGYRKFMRQRGDTARYSQQRRCGGGVVEVERGSSENTKALNRSLILVAKTLESFLRVTFNFETNYAIPHLQKPLRSRQFESSLWQSRSLCCASYVRHEPSKYTSKNYATAVDRLQLDAQHIFRPQWHYHKLLNLKQHQIHQQTL